MRFLLSQKTAKVTSVVASWALAAITLPLEANSQIKHVQIMIAQVLTAQTAHAQITIVIFWTWQMILVPIIIVNLPPQVQPILQKQVAL